MEPAYARRLSENSEGFRMRWQQALKEWSCSELELRTPIVLDGDMTVEQATDMLIREGVRAAPVAKGDNWHGVFDLREAVKFAVQEHEKANPNSEQKSSNEDTQGPVNKFFALFAPNADTESKGQSLTYFSHMRAFPCLPVTSSVFDLIQAISGGDGRGSAHIAGITDESGNMIGVVSQKQLFLAMCAKLKDLFAESSVTLRILADLGLVKTNDLKAIHCDQPAIEAFKMMSREGLSGLAVVGSKRAGGPDDALVHNTSGSDIYLWFAEHRSFDMTIQDFLNHVRRQSLETRAPVCALTMDATFSRAVGKLEATKYHRLWVVNEHDQLIGVMALTDIFRFLTSDGSF